MVSIHIDCFPFSPCCCSCAKGGVMVREVCFTGFERAKVHGRMGRCSISKSTISLTGFLFFFLLLLLLWVLCQTKKFPSFHSRNWAREESRAQSPLGSKSFPWKKKTWRRGIQICNIRLKFWLKRERKKKGGCWVHLLDLFFIFKYWWLNFEKRRYAASTTGEVL